MKRFGSIRTFAIVALLLPGLVTAAPTAGPCGLCGEGDTCHMKQPVKQVSESHSCCGEKSAETPPEPSLGLSDCECGREAPPAVTVESLTALDAASTPASTDETLGTTTPDRGTLSYSSRPAPPPPAPPAYLIDCAFLT